MVVSDLMGVVICMPSLCLASSLWGAGVCDCNEFKLFELGRSSTWKVGRVASMVRPVAGTSQRKVPKNLRNPRRAKVPPEPTSKRIIKKNTEEIEIEVEESDMDPTWDADEIEAISSLFQRRIRQKPVVNVPKERSLPIPLPSKNKPVGLPSPKRHIRSACRTLVSVRSSLSSQVYKNPVVLVGLAREIRDLPPEEDVSQVLDKWLRYLRKGSLSLTIRELGHMSLPERVLQTFCWVQKHQQLYPDDRVLASTVEILARTRSLKMPLELEKFIGSASRSVVEAMFRGLVRAGSHNLARKLLLVAKHNGRTLDPSLHVKLILELGNNPDKYRLVSVLLEELAEREDFNLKQQDCTAVMKVCIKLGKYEAVESIYNWFKESGQQPSVVMYTTIIHSRYCEKKYREAQLIVWEMEQYNCLLDLPAYRVVIKNFAALHDLVRAMRYFSKLKESGFSSTYGIYRDLIKVCGNLGRWSKVEELCKEAKMAGFKLDKEIESLQRVQ